MPTSGSIASWRNMAPAMTGAAVCRIDDERGAVAFSPWKAKPPVLCVAPNAPPSVGACPLGVQ